MKYKRNNHSLLSTLKDLYSRLSAVLIKNRLRSYHSIFQPENTVNITSILNKQVEKLAINSSKTSQVSEVNKRKIKSLDISHTKTSSHNELGLVCTSVSEYESEFAKHLRHRRSSSVNHSHMGDKLKESVWEHIHSAIRYAKQGIIDKAKVHTDIAGHALEEAGHYLSNEEYTDLVCSVESYFKESI